MPVYNLNDVRKVAKIGKIEYRGRKVKRDIENLGYELTDVQRCLMSLTEDDFDKSHPYADSPTDDAYVVDFPNPADEDQTDRLYVKFRLLGDCLYIDLGSFHV